LGSLSEVGHRGRLAGRVALGHLDPRRPPPGGQGMLRQRTQHQHHLLVGQWHRSGQVGPDAALVQLEMANAGGIALGVPRRLLPVSHQLIDILLDILLDSDAAAQACSILESGNQERGDGLVSKHRQRLPLRN
jgi:hypothetical protein